MSFVQLLGNDRLKGDLENSLKSGHISHFYLISGPEGSGKHTLARLLAAAILCQNQDRPCQHCNSCRKALAGTHPDFITVDDPEKKTVQVELIRQARTDMYIQPNEAEYKIYLFPRAQDMGIPSQNALLKVLEEPPKYGVFLLLTDNPDKLLPTVRSRCTQLRLEPLTEQVLKKALAERFPKASDQDLQGAASRSGGILGKAVQLLSQSISDQAAAICSAFAASDALALTKVLTPMEKLKRDHLIPILQECLELFEGGLACRAGMHAYSSHCRDLASKCSPKKLMDGVACLQKCIQYAQQNISPAAICAYLSWHLR